jgi:mRNA-decapping enzyme subunit 2
LGEGGGGLAGIVIPRSEPVMSLAPQKNGIGMVGGMSMGIEEVSAARTASPALSDRGVVDKGKARVAASADGEGKSPVDKNFLLGFLNDVARKGR